MLISKGVGAINMLIVPEPVFPNYWCVYFVIAIVNSYPNVKSSTQKYATIRNLLKCIDYNSQLGLELRTPRLPSLAQKS